MTLDWVIDWLEAMCKGGIVPPFCVELVLKDGAHYFLHSVVAFERGTKTMCARIWDLREFGPKEVEDLKKALNKITDRKNLTPAEAVHPQLDWANVHLRFEDVVYVIEWHDRLWTEADKPNIGFKT